jgi:hypothetical protein
MLNNLFKFVAIDRAFVAFIALEIVAFLERSGLVETKARSENIEIVTEIMSWFFSLLVAGIWYVYDHHRKKHLQVGETPTKPYTKKTVYTLQRVLDLIRQLKNKLFVPTSS